MMRKLRLLIVRLVSVVGLFLAGLPGIPPEDSNRHHSESPGLDDEPNVPNAIPPEAVLAIVVVVVVIGYFLWRWLW